MAPCNIIKAGVKKNRQKNNDFTFLLVFVIDLYYIFYILYKIQLTKFAKKSRIVNDNVH